MHREGKDLPKSARQVREGELGLWMADLLQVQPGGLRP